MRRLLLILILVLPVAAGAQSSSSNYNIWVDAVGGGGGDTTGSSFELENLFGAQGLGVIESTNYSATGGPAGLDPEASLGFSVTTTSLTLDVLTPDQTTTGTILMTAYTNAINGYSITVAGDPPTNAGSEIINAIGATAASSTTGTEQFGLNFVQNTAPAVGADPSGGIGQASTNYDTANQFAFQSGDEVAHADTFSETTTYVGSVIVNVSPTTHHGAYNTSLYFSIVASF